MYKIATGSKHKAQLVYTYKFHNKAKAKAKAKELREIYGFKLKVIKVK